MNFSRSAALVSAFTVTFALAGCNLATTPSDISSFPAQPATISGTVHGGQAPIYNAVVNLYAAGTTGYGSASTLLATTTSDINGNFQFTPGTVSTGVTSSWSCPATTPASDPQIYITAIGGNTQGTGIIATNNTASALMAALGPCSGINSSTRVGLNEISTVASVFALAQYIKPGTAPGTETVGTNAPNLTTSPAQSAVGLNNAVSVIANIANIATGQPITSNAYTGTNASVTGITVTATPESAKLITIANILAACINTSAATSTQCADLFNGAVPPSNPAVTSQPSATFTTALDTIQAAYYMAVNPIDASTTTYTTCNAGGATRLACLFNLAGSSPPFQTGLSTQPSDWTIGVNFTYTGTCTHDSWPSYINAPAKEAVDAAGNIWWVNGSATFATLAGMTPLGKPLACVGSGAGGGTQGAGIAIDPTGNIWASYNSANGTAPLMELPASQIATATQDIVWQTNFSLYTVTIDGSGSVFATGGGHTTGDSLGVQLYELPTPGTITTPFPATLVAAGYGTTGTAVAVASAAPDHNGNIYMSNLTNENVFEASPVTLPISSYSIASGNVVTFYTSTVPTFTVNQNVVVSGLSTTNGLIIDHQGYTVNSINTTAPYSFVATLVPSPTTTPSGFNPTVPTSPTLPTAAQTTDSGIVTGYTQGTWAEPSTSIVFGMAIDSAGELYVGTTCCAATDDQALIKVTPAVPFSSSTQSTSARYIGGDNGVRALALDGADNIWFGTIFPSTGTSAALGNYLIGEATSSGTGTGATFSALSPAGAAPPTCVSTGSTTAAAGCPSGGGFVKSTFLSPTDLAIDPSGNVWVPNTGYDVYNATAGTSTYTYNGTSITQIVGAAVPVVTPIAVAAANGTQATKP